MSEGGFPLFSQRSAGFPALPSGAEPEKGETADPWGPLPKSRVTLTVCATQASISISGSAGGRRLGRMVVTDELQACAPTAAGL